jgi:hypothetical protein
MSNRRHFIVEVDGFNGELNSVEVRDADGAPLSCVYCVAVQDDNSGVLRFVDYGYPTIEAARAAWPHAE